MVGTRRLAEVVGSVSERLKLPDGPLVVALSGGADSAALAYLCASRGREVRALHVNHGLAGSTLMEKAARQVCERLALEIEVAAVEVPQGPSPEGQARRVRYSAFAERVVPEERLITGHTRDDDVETILLNIVRGTGVRGLTGIPYFRPPGIYRPILGIDRNETRHIAGLAGLGFVDDPMNEDPGLARNVMRQSLIPALRQMNPKLGDSLLRMAAAVAADSEYLESLTPYDLIGWADKAASAPLGPLTTAPEPIRDRLVMKMISGVAGGAAISTSSVERVRSVVDGRHERQEIQQGVVAERLGPKLVVSVSREPTRGESPVTLKPGVSVAGRIEFTVSALKGPCRVVPLSKWAAVFPEGTDLVVQPDGVVFADGEAAWVPGVNRLPVAWYEPGSIGYLSVFAREKTGWTSSR